MTVTTLREKFVYHLEMTHYVENRLLDVLDQLASEVASDDLRDGVSISRAEDSE